MRRKQPGYLDKDLIIGQEKGCGMLVDGKQLTYGWRDLEGVELVDVDGVNRAVLAVYRGAIREFHYPNNAILDLRYHVPHDYAPGTDMFFHIHWSHIGTGISGSFTPEVTHTYAKGFNQAPFSTPKLINVDYPCEGILALPQYQHMITEVPISVRGGSATELDSDDIEIDGLILVNLKQITGDLAITGGSVNNPFIHRADIHYQSTNVPTKGKAPYFYT